MTCPWNDRLDDVLLNEADATERLAVRSHLLTCAPCAARWAALETVTERLLDEAAAVQAPADLTERIMDELDDVNLIQPATLRDLTWLRPRMLIPLAAAAVFFMLLFRGAVETTPRAATPAARALASSPSPSQFPSPAPLPAGHDLTCEAGSRVTLAWGERARLDVVGPAVLHRGPDGPVLDEGELFCDVRPGNTPFAVTTPDARIEVRGTAFRVIRRDPADGTLVTVSRGAVAVIPASGSEPRILGPGGEHRVGGRPQPASPSPIPVPDAPTIAVDDATAPAPNDSPAGDADPGDRPASAQTIEEGF